ASVYSLVKSTSRLAYARDRCRTRWHSYDSNTMKARLRWQAWLWVLTTLVASACTSATSITGITGPIPPSALTARQTAFLDTLERRTFDWFWDRTDNNNGLTPDRWPTPSFSSGAAIGFALTAYPVGVERGYVTRSAAATRTLNTLRFMYNAPQGAQATNVTGYKGFFYH